MSSDVVRALIWAARDDRPGMVPVTLLYAADDPYAVRVMVPCPDRREVVAWDLGRELLAAGLSGMAGEGLVLVSPTYWGDIALIRGIGDPIALHLDAAELRDFLTRTYALVLPETESRYMDVDLTIEVLLNDVAGGAS